MSLISEEFLQELKYSSDIESIVSSYVTLKRSGRTLSGLCPFHSEKSASFHVYPESQSFFCFGCGVGGDVVTFIRRIENLEYVEAVKFLAQRAGLPMPEDVQDDGISRLKLRILEMNREAARHFHQNLISPEGSEGQVYLLERGMSVKTVRHFGLGYALRSWDDLYRHLLSQGFQEEEILAAALAGKNRNGKLYDLFRHRIIFPIIDLRGNVIGFGGRALDSDGPKYLNSSDTPVFKKSRNLFAMNFAKNSKEKGLILAEGYMDVISIHQAGIDNAVATLGTALTSEQTRLISQYTDEVQVAYDSDQAGQKAAKRAVELFSPTGVKVKIVSLPNAKDPDEYLKKFGVQRFRLLLEGSSSSTEFEINQIRKQYDLSSADGKTSYLKAFAACMAQVANPIERDVYISREAGELGVSKEVMVLQVNHIIAQRTQTKKKKEANDLPIFAASPQAGRNRESEQQRRAHIRCAVAEDRLITLLLKHPDFYEYLSGKIQPEQFLITENRAIFSVLYDRLRQHLPIDISSLSPYLDMEAMAHTARLLNTAASFQFTKAEADDYMQTICQHQQEKTPQEVAQMSSQEFQQYISSLASKKK